MLSENVLLKCSGLKFRSSQDIIIKMASPEIDGEELAQRMNNPGATLDGLGILFQEGECYKPVYQQQLLERPENVSTIGHHEERDAPW